MIASIFILIGSLFALIAAFGLIRMPDIFCRMHSATKAGSFGVSLILIGVICAVPEPRVVIQSMMIIFFFYLTAPVASQMIGRIALRKNSRIWKPSQDKANNNK